MFREQRGVVAALVLAAVATMAACSSLLDLAGSGCAGVGYYAVRVAISDQYGSPQALGATVTLTDGSYQEQDGTDHDPLNVLAASERGGRTYDIRVSKPYYSDVVVRGVRAPGGGCVTGHESTPVTVTVPVTITTVSGAPAIRSVFLVPHHVLLDRQFTTSYAFTAYVDANPGVSRALSWSIVGDTASVAFDAASGTLTYRCRATSGYLIMRVRSLIDATMSDTADVAVQGHPAATNDPPCA